MLILNILRPEQNDRHFEVDTYQCIYVWNKCNGWFDFEMMCRGSLRWNRVQRNILNFCCIKPYWLGLFWTILDNIYMHICIYDSIPKQYIEKANAAVGAECQLYYNKTILRCSQAYPCSIYFTCLRNMKYMIFPIISRHGGIWNTLSWQGRTHLYCIIN